jgi:two-component system phosphate regulon response regulator PhoB
MPDLAFDAADWAGPPVAEAHRPVALVIEDDPAARAQLTAILERAGWSVRQARDGEQGLLMAREHVPEVILLDLALPGTSGLEVLRELKSARWADQPTPVVVVSFFAGLLRLPDLRLADGLVQKPLGAADLLVQVAVARACRRAPVLM